MLILLIFKKYKKKTRKIKIYKKKKVKGPILIPGQLLPINIGWKLKGEGGAIL